MSNYKHRGYNQKKRRNEEENTSDSVTGASSDILQMFKTFQIELDAKHDKHERLVKKSRDVTIESKRIIFLLHRVTSSGDNEEILQEAEKRLSALLKTSLSEIALELNKREVYQYLRAFTAGLQEFVEAVSFYHYLRNGNLISLEEVYGPVFSVHAIEVIATDSEKDKEDIRPHLGLCDMLTPVDYVLGICDLTGELMRKCINSVGTGDIDEPFKLSVILQSIYEALMVCGNHSKELKRKLFTLKCSLQKVENACYAIKIRGTETPKHMLADFFSTEDDFKEPEACDI